MSRHISVMMQLLEQVDRFPITTNAIVGLLKGKGFLDMFVLAITPELFKV